jgi:hypothetical protein
MYVLRVRTNLTVPLGETAVVGGGGIGGRTRLVLLTPEVRRLGTR